MTYDIRQILAKNLRYYREQCCLTQRDLADEIDCTAKHIAAIENGNSGCSMDCLQRIAEVLKVSPASLLQTQNERTLSQKIEWENIDDYLQGLMAEHIKNKPD